MVKELAYQDTVLIQSAQGLIRLRFVSSDKGNQLVTALSRSLRQPTNGGQAQTQTFWSICGFDSSHKPHLGKETAIANRIRDFDVLRAEGKTIWVFELNQQKALLAQQLDFVKDEAPSRLLDLGELLIPVDLPLKRLSEVQIEKSWHAMMPPKKWLFQPRVRVGPNRQLHIVCNTADNHLLELDGPHDPEPNADSPFPTFQEIRFEPDKFSPIVVGKTTAYLKLSGNENLFYSLKRYSGASNPRGRLQMELGSGAVPIDLSNRLQMKDVVAFDMAAVANLGLIIGALHSDRENKPTLTLIRSTDGGKSWERMLSMELPKAGEGQQLALIDAGGGQVRVAFAIAEDDFSMIRTFVAKSS